MGFSITNLTSGLTRSEKGPTHTDNERIGPHDEETNSRDYEKRAADDARGPSSSEEELNKIDTTEERGTQAMQAMVHVWTKKQLILCYIFVWLINFVFAFGGGIFGTLTPYITSSFGQHSLTALTDVIAGLIAGIFKLPFAKIMTIWGRPFAMVLAVTLATLGVIMMAGTNNVKTYCAAKVFWYVGYNCVDFTIVVFTADTSKLKNRALIIGYLSSPYLITTYTQGYAVTDILSGIGTRWGFGIFAIFIPLTCIPFISMLYYNEIKARKQGLIEPIPSRGNLSQTIVYYLKEFDVVGLLILATGLAIFLLAFNIYSLQAKQWESPMIICFIVFGVLLIAVFVVWEKWFAPVNFIPWPLLKNRTVIFTYSMAFFTYLAFYVWDSYFYSLLIVLFNQSIVHATYINSIWSMGSCFTCLVYGVFVRYVYGRLKVISAVWAAPLTLLGCGLMIHFREPNQGVGYVVMCYILFSFGAAVNVTNQQATLMAVSKQGDFPALLAGESMVIAIGGAIGSTIAGAMWTGIFPKKLLANLPASALDNFANIYGDIDVQSGYPWGSPEREAINLSYSQTQKLMLSGAMAAYACAWFSIFFWQDLDIRKMKQRTLGLL